MLKRLIMVFGVAAFFFGVVMLFDHSYLLGILMIVAGLPTAIIPLGLSMSQVIASWRMPGDSQGTLANRSLRWKLKVLGVALTLMGLVPAVCGIVIEALIWTHNHDDPPIPMPLLLLAGLVPSGLLLLLGFGLVNAGRLTMTGDGEGVESGLRLGWILLAFCVLTGGSITDGRTFWVVAGTIGIPTGVLTLLTCLAILSIRKPMEKVRSEFWEARNARNAARREASMRAERIKSDEV